MTLARAEAAGAGAGTAPGTARVRVTFVLGKPAERSPVLPDVVARLRAGTSVTVRVPGRRDHLNPAAPCLRDADLVVVRGLGRRALDALRDAERAGVRCCNRIAAITATRNRAVVGRLLADAGMPVPESVEARTWPEVTHQAAGRSVVVKAVGGVRGLGAGVLVTATGSPPAQPPFAGPYLVQGLVPGDGWDRKLYVIGGRVAGLLKRWPRPAGRASRSPPFPVPAEMARLARRVGEAIGLEIYGVDVVAGPAGPVIVDVNPFPSCQGVPGAAASIADHLLHAARARRSR